jgi:hypothetical protein
MFSLQGKNPASDRSRKKQPLLPPLPARATRTERKKLESTDEYREKAQFVNRDP